MIMLNPFTPNFGQVPAVLAGRESVIADITEVFESNSNSPARTSILVGARGTGKTALLALFSGKARQSGWLSVDVTCLPGMLEDIVQQALTASAEFTDTGNRHLTGVTIGSFIGVEWQNESDRSKNWRTRMTEILDRLADHNIGLLITVDEVTARLDEMIQLSAAYQMFIRENRKVALIMAGLPAETSALLRDGSVSFLRRASLYELKRLDDYDVEEALVNTVSEGGKTILKEAVELAKNSIEGFPYMLQLVGYRSWEASGDRNEIGSGDAECGISRARIDLERRVLRATLDELSDGDLDFLEAMSQDDEYTSVTDLEGRLGKNSGYISRYRSRLIERGVIEPKGRGKVRFALPYLKEYLNQYLETR